jgi:hypothetical protein
MFARSSGVSRASAAQATSSARGFAVIVLP